MKNARRWQGVIATAAVTVASTIFAVPGYSNAGEEAAGGSDHLESHRRDQSLKKAEEARWRGQHEALSNSVVQARARLQRAVADYTRAHGPTRGRGGARARAVEERDAAQAALTKAEDRLAAFMEEARRANVPPGWLRPAQKHGSQADIEIGDR